MVRISEPCRPGTYASRAGWTERTIAIQQLHLGPRKSHTDFLYFSAARPPPASETAPGVTPGAGLDIEAPHLHPSVPGEGSAPVARLAQYPYAFGIYPGECRWRVSSANWRQSLLRTL